MKRSFVLGLMVCAVAGFVMSMATQTTYAQAPKSPADSAMVSTAGADIKVYYSRPSKRGREIFGKLVPYGEVWRTGANGATEIVFSKDVNFGGKAVKAGRYALFTIPTKDKWTVILSSKLGQWGAFSYNAKDDVVRVEATPAAQKDVTEMFIIKLDKADKGASLVMMWDQTSVTVPVSVN
jgi:hypothetical protein